MMLKRDKCVFVKPFINYHGHILSGGGLQLDLDTVEAVVKTTPQANRKQLESFIWLVQYYGHVPNLSSLVGQLNELGKKRVRFEWTLKRQSTYDKIKKELSSRRVLMSYNELSHLDIKADAFENRIGAVSEKDLTNLRRTPKEGAISYASISLSAANRNYSQSDKTLSLSYSKA